MTRSILTFVSVMAIISYSQSQDLQISKDVSMELTKTSKSGRYGGTLISGDQVKVIYVSSTKKEGAQVEEYDMDLSSSSTSVNDKFIEANEAEQTMPWFMPKSRVENLTEANGKWLQASRAFGSAMKLSRGYMQKQYTLGVYTGMKFIKEESIKPKTGDIWRITPGGYKSLSDIDAMATEYGFYRDLQKYGNPLTMPANATLLASGVITEKVSLKSDQKYAANRVAVLTMNGMNFDEMKHDIYLLPYTASTVISGLGQNDNLVSLFAPLNGPTTLKSLKHLYWKENKNHFTVMRFGDDRSLIDSVSFKSKMMWGDYEILNGNGSTYIVGKGDAKFDGWYRAMAYKKVTGIQVVKIKDDKVVFQKLYGQDLIEEKLVGAGGGKVKFNIFLQRNKLDEILDLPNGDALIIGHNPLQQYAMQISASGDLKAFYMLPIGKQGEIGIMNYQYTMKGNDLILVVNLQPTSLSTDAQVSSSSFKSHGAGITTTITTTKVEKLNEVFMHSMVYRLNTDKMTMSNALAFNGKNFFTMGSFPAMFTENAIYFAGREKAPKGKIIHVVRIDY